MQVISFYQGEHVLATRVFLGIW